MDDSAAVDEEAPKFAPMKWAEPGDADPLIGQLVGDKYRVLKRIGAGAMGTVYKVEHQEMGRFFALKVLKKQYTRQAEFYQRFAREARAGGRIEHSHVVDVTDFGRDGELVYYVMDFLNGAELRELLERLGKLPWTRARRLVLQLLDAVAAAHAAGFVHRDLKPENLFLVEGHDDDHLLVLDFGIAKALRADEVGSSITSVGTILGSPRYMSPEQCMGKAADERSDVYAIGVILYEMLMGRPPFVHRRIANTLRAHVTEAPAKFSEVAPGRRFPPGVEAIVMRALSKSPAKRFESAEAFAAAVEAIPDEAAPVAGKAKANAGGGARFWGGAAWGLIFGLAVGFGLGAWLV